MACDLCSDKSDPPDIQIAMLLRETQLGRQELTNNIAVQKRNRPSGLFKQPEVQRLSERGFPRAGKSGSAVKKIAVGHRPPLQFKLTDQKPKNLRAFSPAMV